MKKDCLVLPAMINKSGDIHPDSHIINRYCHTYEFTEQLRTIPFLKIDFAASVPTHITFDMILSVHCAYMKKSCQKQVQCTMKTVIRSTLMDSYLPMKLESYRRS